LTLEHNFEDKHESERAIEKGGRVARMEINGKPTGPMRIFSKTSNIRPGLAVSRSLGDMEAHACGVSSDPDILHLEREDHEDVLIVASDGMWDMLSGEMIMQKLDKSGWNAKSFENILQSCARRWIYSRTGVCDDISIVAFKFGYNAERDGSPRIVEQPSQSLPMEEQKPVDMTTTKPEILVKDADNNAEMPVPSRNSREFDVEVKVDMHSPTQTDMSEEKLKKLQLRESALKQLELKDVKDDDPPVIAVEALNDIADFSMPSRFDPIQGSASYIDLSSTGEIIQTDRITSNEDSLLVRVTGDSVDDNKQMLTLPQQQPELTQSESGPNPQTHHASYSDTPPMSVKHALEHGKEVLEKGEIL